MAEGVSLSTLVSEVLRRGLADLDREAYAQRSQPTFAMGRISIDVTDVEHAKLKALAALKGQSIRDFVLSRTIGDVELAPHLAELEALLDERISRARTEGTSDRTVKDIFEQARPDGGPDRDA